MKPVDRCAPRSSIHEADAILVGGRADPTANSCTGNCDEALRKKCSETEWFSHRSGTRRLHATYYEASMGIYMGKVGETVKHPATWVKIAKAICKPPAVPVALRIAAAISAYPSARSDRKRGLAKLRLDDGPLRRCGIRPGWQLQHCRTLAIAQTRD